MTPSINPLALARLQIADQELTIKRYRELNHGYRETIRTLQEVIATIPVSRLEIIDGRPL